MNSKVFKIMAGVAIALTVLLAFLGYRMSREYAETSQKAATAAAVPAAAPNVPRFLAVVAIKPLAADRKIAKDDVRLAEMSVEPKDYYTSLEQVVGKVPRVDIDQGAPVTKRYFGEGNVLARSIPPGFQAISVEVSDVIAVGGFVRPGDLVDVLLYLRGGNDIQDAQARVLMKDARVLAYHELIVDRPAGIEDDEKAERSRRQRTAVLAVPDADTTRLMLGASMGELRLALHGLPATEIAAASPDAESPLVEGMAAGGLPANAEAIKIAEEKKVPDKAYTARQLGRIELPPAEKKKVVVREKVTIYRASELETVTP